MNPSGPKLPIDVLREYPKMIETVGTDRVTGKIVKKVTRVETPDEEEFVRRIDAKCLDEAMKKETQVERPQ